NLPGVEPASTQQFGVALAAAPEAEARPDGDDPRSDRGEIALDELGRGQGGYVFRELDDEDVLDAALAEELQAPLEGREQLDLVPEHRPRVRVERDDRRHKTRVDSGADDGAL